MYKHPEESRRSIAPRFRVSQATLICRIKGGKTRTEAQQPRQLLTTPEKDAIEDSCIRLANLGFLASTKVLCSMVGQSSS